jgi:hypothetical protein
MCQRVNCPKCGRPTYAGCGRHVEQVLGDVAADARCACREEKAGSESSSLVERVAKFLGR